jgi:hypothetical protein
VADFKSDESMELTEKQISAFIDSTIERDGGQAMLNELRTLMTSGRDQIGWKQFCRKLLEALK